MFDYSLTAKVHAGFQNLLYSPIYDYVAQTLQKLTISELIFTGMSMGGAIAPLCAARVLKLGKINTKAVPIWCLTYAAPKYGDMHLNNAINHIFGGKRYFRFVSPPDIFTDLPCIFTHTNSGAGIWTASFREDWLYSKAATSGFTYNHITDLRHQNKLGHGYYLGIWFNWGRLQSMKTAENKMFRPETKPRVLHKSCLRTQCHQLALRTNPFPQAELCLFAPCGVAIIVHYTHTKLSFLDMINTLSHLRKLKINKLIIWIAKNQQHYEYDSLKSRLQKKYEVQVHVVYNLHNLQRFLY